MKYLTHARLTYLPVLAGLVGFLSVSACSFDPALELYEPPPNVDPLLGCNGSCHGDTYSVAPPGDLEGNTDPSSPGVGAHRIHLNPAPGWHLKVDCSDCHVVPTTVEDPGHLDGDGVAELTFSARATNNGQVAITFENGRCDNAACHGATTTGGALTTPVWTEPPAADGLECNDCHGFPPPPPHEAITDCGVCHTTVAANGPPNQFSFLSPGSHINGTVDTAMVVGPDPPAQTCHDCHGSLNNPAPPTDLDGNTNVTEPGVGAHQAHVGASSWRRLLYCTQCHTLPVNIDAPGHIDGDGVAEVTFDGLNPNGTYTNNTCANLYCHGNGRGQQGTMVWNVDVPDLGNNCTACHDDSGNDLSGRHEIHLRDNIDCDACHASAIGPQRVFVEPELHINGVHDVAIAGAGGGVWDAAEQRCFNGPCHNGSKEWRANGN